MASLVEMQKRQQSGEVAEKSHAAEMAQRVIESRRDPDAVVLLCTQITVDEQARKDLGDLKPLAKSIKEHGQMNAVVVVPTDHPHKFKLSKGERRYFAIRDELEQDTIRATIDRSGIENDRVKFRLGQLHENIQRKDYLPFELAHEFDGILKETGWTQSALADEVGVTKGWVSRKLSLLKAPPEIQAAIQSGEMAETDYYNDKSGTTTRETSRGKPGGEGGGSENKPKTPKKFAMSWEDAASLGTLLVGLVRKEYPEKFSHLTITSNASPEEIMAFFDEVKGIWYTGT